ncbi:hypothetical protein HCK42_003541, partial [Salmonella enterica]|nr:hypothetical protein [Salmonella enterica]EGF0797194.1 hypothetical protein [Salmonella enterica]
LKTFIKAFPNMAEGKTMPKAPLRAATPDVVHRKSQLKAPVEIAYRDEAFSSTATDKAAHRPEEKIAPVPSVLVRRISTRF